MDNSLSQDFVLAQNEFNIALANGLRVAQKCVRIQTDKVGKIADQLHSRNIITALTVKFIINPPKRTGYPGMPPSFILWDKPSLCVLSRCLLETYLIMFYLCVDNVSTEERDFRLLWWEWHEIAERVRLAEAYGSNDPRLIDEREERDTLVGNIKSHRFFLQQNVNDQKELIEKKLNRNRALIVSLKEIAVNAGIHAGQFRNAYDYFSQFIHTLPLANCIVDGFTPDSMFLPIRWATAWLAFSIRDFVKLFPSGKDVTDLEFWQITNFYSDLLATDLSLVKAPSPTPNCPQ